MSGTVGVDVGGTTIKGVRRRADGSVEERHEGPTPDTAEGFMEAVTAIAEGLGPGLPVGVGLAGLVDHRRGVFRWGPHLPGADVMVGEILAERLDVPVVVDNDANLAALAEHFVGCRPGSWTTVMLTLGSGIGMGTVVDGRIFHGRGHAGEVGHVIVEPGGVTCVCGRQGCWETMVSGHRLDGDAVEVLGVGATGRDLTAAAQAGNAAAAVRIAAAGAWLGVGIEAIVLTLDPDVVVVGGAAAAAGDALLAPVRRRLADTEGSAHRPTTEVRAGILGPYAGAIGAAMAAESAAEGKT